MLWYYSLIGIMCSMAVLLLLAVKWRLPVSVALWGGGISACVVAFFFWLVSFPAQGWFGILVAIALQVFVTICLVLAILVIHFYRDPERDPSESDGVIISAADGKVRYVWTLEGDETPMVMKKGNYYQLEELTGIALTGEATHVIGIDMNLLDVHVNRCPISGQVKLIKYIEGKFLSLRRDDAPFKNERLTTVIENGDITVATVQIASRLVRRVRSYLKLGQEVGVGEKLGVITLGSLVAVIIPVRDDVRIEIEPGERVKAGLTVLARYGAKEG